MSTSLPLAITQGDPAGIGPEIVAKAFRDAPRDMRGCFVVGDLATLRRAAACIERPGDTSLPLARIDLAHAGIFEALVAAAGLPESQESQLLAFLRDKDEPALAEALAGVASPWREALAALPRLYGGAEVIERAAAVLPALPAIEEALSRLRYVLQQAPELPFSIDLADLRGYHYHNGIVFAAYCPNYPAAIALGGRYDGAGEVFGRARPATGFSLDLREVARLAPRRVGNKAILAPHAGTDAGLAAEIVRLRAEGEIVVELLPGETNCEAPACDRKLVAVGGQWLIEAILED